VKQLGVRLTFSTGVNAGHEAAPLVVNNTMYVVTPWPNIVYALDLTRPGAPVKWQYAPKPLAAAKGVACCDVVSRGAAYADGALYFNTLDNHTIPLHAPTGATARATGTSSLGAGTGSPRGEATLGDITPGESMTMAPLVVKDKVLVGNS